MRTKAIRHKEAHILDCAGMEKLSESFLSFSMTNISAKLNSVGLSLFSNVFFIM
jgi:hypothetical protein